MSRIFQISEVLIAQTESGESWAFLGEDSLAWLVFAFGAAMVVGNVLAMVRPPKGQTESPPKGRAIAMILVGGVAAVWGLASIIS